MKSSEGVVLVSNAVASPTGRKLLRVVTVCVVLAGTTLVAGSAPAATPCTSPPSVFPESSITPGMSGTGLTAVQGTTPTSFDISVIGTLPNALLPGFDLVVFKITGPASFIDQAHGVAAGMSGSPIYIGGQLAGAVSYSFGFAADPMVGLFTPAQQMVDLIGYANTTPRLSMPNRVPVTDAVRRAVAKATGVAVSQVPGSVQQLTIPLAVTGLSDKRAGHLQAILDRHGLPLRVYRAGGAASSAAAAVDPSPLAPGAPLAADLSTGDVTFAGIGTTTFACGDLNVGWGHDFFFQGPSAFAMGGASVVTIVNDVSGIFGPFKVLVPTELHGTVTQDRLAGLVGQVGSVPPAMPVTTTFTNTDTNKSRTGETDIFYQQDFWGPEITYEHVFENLLLVFDHFGKGTLGLSYRIQGLRQDGTPFTVKNSNMAYSEYNAFQAAYRLLNAMYDLAFNRFEDVTFTSVQATGEITSHQLVGDIVKIRSESSLQHGLRQRSVLKAKAGGTIRLEVSLQPVEGGKPVDARFTLRVPGRAGGTQRISIRGGKARKRINVRSLRSFHELLSLLNGGESPNDLIVSGLGRQITQPQDLVVKGGASLTVNVVK